MSEPIFTAEKYKEMFRAGIITEDDMCLMIEELTKPPEPEVPEVPDIPSSKIAEGVKLGNKFVLGIGVTTLTTSIMERALPADMNPLKRLIAKYTTGVILGGFAAIAAKEFDEKVDDVHVIIHTAVETYKTVKDTGENVEMKKGPFKFKLGKKRKET